MFLFSMEPSIGKSKGVMLTHRNITSNLVQIMDYDAEVIKEKDLVVLGFLPLYHIYGLMNCLHISTITVSYFLLSHPFILFPSLHTLHTGYCRCILIQQKQGCLMHAHFVFQSSPPMLKIGVCQQNNAFNAKGASRLN